MSELYRFRRGLLGPLVVLAALTIATSTVMASTPGADVRLTNDDHSLAGYVSADDLAGLTHYTDATLDECSRSRGRQNEPSVGIDPRNNQVIIGSSNDYCAVYNDGSDADGAPIASGPIWLGYYRSEDGGGSFTSSLVPGYPGDTSVLGALAQIRTASSGDPVIAWDNHGRVFMGSESSGDPLGSPKSFGDEWVGRYVNPGGTGATINDGKKFAGSVIVAKGVSAPNLLGKFNDKTAIEADRTDTACEGNVYFAWSQFFSDGSNAIMFSRSTDHGKTWSQPTKLSESIQGNQGPDISVTGNGHVYVTWRQFPLTRVQTTSVAVAKSTDCGASFSFPSTIVSFEPMGLTDRYLSGGRARDCGDFGLTCQSGYTFFRADTLPRSTADANDTSHEWVFIVYEAIVPGSEVSTGTTFGWAAANGAGGQSSVYFVRYDGKTGIPTPPERVDPISVGQQLFPDLSVDAGVVHALWWDSRNDVNNDASSFKIRPIGDDANGNVGPGFDVFAATRPAGTGSWTSATRLTDVTSNGQYEQFSGRTVPFGGDYLWIDSKGGTTFGVWTDWRDTVGGTDLRETTPDETGADVKQCRTQRLDGSFTGDTCPRAGGLDQNIYGDLAP